MDPITWAAIIGGASTVVGKVVGGGGAPPAPNVSSAYGGYITAPFNVGGGIGGAGQLGALGSWLPILVLGAIAWLALKK